MAQTKKFTCGSATGYLTWNEPKLARIHSIFSLERGNGHGSQVILDMCKYADDNQITLYLNVRRYLYRDSKSPDNDGLVAWYKKFGFVVTDRKHPIQMHRNPKSQK